MKIKYKILNALFFTVLLFAPQIYAVTPSTIDMTAMNQFLKDVGTRFENFFHVKFENPNQMMSVMREKEIIYEVSLSTCKPGTYYYGYMDMFPIFVTTTIEGWQNGKCIESSSASPAASLPNRSGETTQYVIKTNCQYKPESLHDFANASPAKKKSIRTQECQIGKLLSN